MITSGLQNPEFLVKHGQLATEYNVDGIRILAIRAGYNDGRAGTSMPGWKRMLSFHNFSRIAARVGKWVQKPDLVFATHTPLTVGLTGIELKKHFMIPFVFEVRDLWPEALVNIGVLKNPFFVTYLRWMSRKIYRAADHISAASPGMKYGILKYGIPEEKVTVVTNASDLDLFYPQKDGSAERERLGLGNRFAAIYFGAMGQANGLDYALDAASELKRRHRSDIVIVLHGSGGRRDGLKTRALAEGLDNIVFSNPVKTKEQMSRILAGCDVCMTIYKASKEVTWSPNKLFDALAAGKPVVVNVPGWLGDTVENNNCGIQTDPEDAEKLADALEKLADDYSFRRKCAENSRRLAEEEFARDKQTAKLEAVFRKLVLNA